MLDPLSLRNNYVASYQSLEPVAPTSDDIGQQKEGAEVEVPLPPCLKFSSKTPDVECLQMQYRKGVVNSEGELTPKYAGRDLEPLNPEEKLALHKKLFGLFVTEDVNGSLLRPVSIGKLLNVFMANLSSKFVVSEINWIGGDLPYTLISRYSNYCKRAFNDLPIEANQALSRAIQEQPFQKPADVDLRISIAHKHRGNLLTKSELQEVCSFFLQVVDWNRPVACSKFVTVYSQWNKFQVVFLKGTDMELTLCVELEREHLFTRDSFYLPIKDFLLDDSAPCVPKSYSSSPRQGLFDGIHKIVRANNRETFDRMGFYRLMDLLTKGESPGEKGLTATLANKMLKGDDIATCAAEIKRFLKNHHPNDVIKQFAYLFNLTHFGEFSDEQAAELWHQVYGYAPFQDSWMGNTIAEMVSKRISFSSLVSVFNAAFTLTYQTEGASLLQVNQGHFEFAKKVYKVPFETSFLQLLAQDDVKVPFQRDQLELFSQLFDWKKGFVIKNRVSNLGIFSCLQRDTTCAKLAELLEFVETNPEYADVAGELALSILSDKSLPKGAEHKVMISNGLVDLLAQVSSLKLAQALMKYGAGRGIILKGSSERQHGWISLLKKEWENDFDENKHYDLCSTLIERGEITRTPEAESYFSNLLTKKATNCMISKWLSMVFVSRQQEFTSLSQLFSHPEGKAWKTNTKFLSRFLELLAEDKENASDQFVPTYLALVKELNAYESLKPAVESVFPMICKILQGKECSLFLDLLQAAKRTSLHIDWSQDVEKVWKESLEGAVHNNPPRLRLAQEMLQFPAEYRGSQAAGDASWCSLGRKYIEMKNIVGVQSCIKEVNNIDGTGFLFAASKLLLEDKLYEKAIATFEKIYSLNTEALKEVWPLYQSAILKLESVQTRIEYLKKSAIVTDIGVLAKKLVRDCSEKMLASKDASKHSTRMASELLLQFSSLFTSGDPALWLNLLEKLSKQNSRQVWPVLKKIDPYLLQDEEQRNCAWQEALNALFKSNPKEILDLFTSEHLPRSFRPEGSDRLDEAMVECFKRKNARQRLDVLSKLYEEDRLLSRGKVLCILEGLKSTQPRNKEMACSLIRKGLAVYDSWITQKDVPLILTALLAKNSSEFELAKDLYCKVRAEDKAQIDFTPLYKFCLANPTQIDLSQANMCWLCEVLETSLGSGHFPKNETSAKMLSGLMALLEQYCPKQGSQDGSISFILAMLKLYSLPSFREGFPKEFYASFFWEYLIDYLKKSVSTIDYLEGSQILGFITSALSNHSKMGPSQKKILNQMFDFIVELKCEDTEFKSQLITNIFKVLIDMAHRPGHSSRDFFQWSLGFIEKALSTAKVFDRGLMEAIHTIIGCVLIPYFPNESGYIAKQIERCHEKVKASDDKKYLIYWKKVYRQLYGRLFENCLNSEKSMANLEQLCEGLTIPSHLKNNTEAVRSQVDSLSCSERELKRNVRVDGFVRLSNRLSLNASQETLDFFHSFLMNCLRDGWFREEPSTAINLTGQVVTTLLDHSSKLDDVHELCLELLSFLKKVCNSIQPKEILMCKRKESSTEAAQVFSLTPMRQEEFILRLKCDVAEVINMYLNRSAKESEVDAPSKLRIFFFDIFEIATALHIDHLLTSESEGPLDLLQCFPSASSGFDVRRFGS